MFIYKVLYTKYYQHYTSTLKKMWWERHWKEEVLEYKLMTTSENLSSYISILYMLEENQLYANSWVVSGFFVQTGLWILILFVVFTEECECCGSVRILRHRIQSVTAVVIVPTSFSPMCLHAHALQGTCYFYIIGEETEG